ncbi:hypothetical protein D6D01_03529, partial [Aureobasidium pullulans]
SAWIVNISHWIDHSTACAPAGDRRTNDLQPLLLAYHYNPLGPPRCGVSILATTKLAGFRLLLSLSLPSQGPKIWVCGGDKKPP